MRALVLHALTCTLASSSNPSHVRKPENSTFDPNTILGRLLARAEEKLDSDSRKFDVYGGSQFGSVIAEKIYNLQNHGCWCDFYSNGAINFGDTANKNGVPKTQMRAVVFRAWIFRFLAFWARPGVTWAYVP